MRQRIRVLLAKHISGIAGVSRRTACLTAFHRSHERTISVSAYDRLGFVFGITPRTDRT